MRMGTFYYIYVDGVKDSEFDYTAVLNHNPGTNWWFGAYGLVQHNANNRFHGAIGKAATLVTDRNWQNDI